MKNYFAVVVIVLLLAGAGIYVFNHTYVERNTSIEINDTHGVASTTSPATDVATSVSTYTFSDHGKTLSFTYPKEVIVSRGGIGYSTAWQNQSTTSGLVLVTAILPQTFQPKTNFSNAKFTVGSSADSAAMASCIAGPVGLGIRSTSVSIHGQSYTKISYADAGAGNRYDTTSYRTVRNKQCFTIEYTIHSTAIDNYDPTQGISAFNETSVTHVMESIVQSVTIL